MSKRDRIVGGRFRFSIIDLFGLYFDSIGLAEARIEVRAFSDVMIPAFAIDTVCCSMTSCRMVRVFSVILSNSSMQQIPPSDRTSAPLQPCYYSRASKQYLSRTSCPDSLSLMTYAVRPTAEEPFPDVYMPLGDSL